MKRLERYLMTDRERTIERQQRHEAVAQERPWVRYKKARKIVNYEQDPPRCENCARYVKPHSFMVDSTPIHAPAKCKTYDFPVKSTAICDYWRGKNGDRLDTFKGANDETA